MFVYHSSQWASWEKITRRSLSALYALLHRWAEVLQRGKNTQVNAINDFCTLVFPLPCDGNDHRFLKLEGLWENLLLLVHLSRNHCLQSTWQGVYGLLKIGNCYPRRWPPQVTVRYSQAPWSYSCPWANPEQLSSPFPRKRHLQTLQGPTRSCPQVLASLD